MRLLAGLAASAFLIPLLTACAPQETGADAAPAARARLVETNDTLKPAPEPLAQRVQELGRGFRGDVGIAVRDIENGWVAEYQGRKAFPQQSVAKLWVALATLDAVDRGELRLQDIALVRQEDLSVFHQPIRRLVGREGFLTNLEDLMRRALTQSDNAANQMLVTRLGGPDAVQAFIERKGLGPIRFGPGERALQSGIAGLQWRPEYSQGWEFQKAREQLPAQWRWERLESYLADPMDGATPVAIVGALARLERGELLSASATRHVLSVMADSRTGPKRLRGGLPEGWRIFHKTGTGQDLGATSTGYNDVAVLVAPDGHAYAVAVMIGRTTHGIPARQALMSNVTRAIVAHHEGRNPAEPAGAAGPVLEVAAAVDGAGEASAH